MLTERRLIITTLVIALLVSGCTSVSLLPPEATTATPGPEWVIFDHENTELSSHGTVYDLAVGDQNTVWAGTSDGLARYGVDGWTWYTTENSDLPNDRVTALAIDVADNVWVGTHDGLARFDGANWEVFTTENSGLPYQSVHELAFDQEGILWIGTGCFFCSGSRGLARFDGAEWKTYDIQNSDLPSNHIIGLAIDDQGTKWIGTTGPLVRFDGEQWTDFSKVEGDEQLKGNDFPGISMDPAGDIWVSSGGSGGIAHFDGEHWTRYRQDETPLPSRYAEEIFVDSQGTRWIGTREGVAKFDDSGWTIYDTSNSDLPENWIWTITEDEYGNIWIGTSYGGLAVHREGGVLLP